MNTMNRFTIIGLGNPGKKYGNTRHNAGKMFVKWIKEKGKMKNEKVETRKELDLIETECFMNESGRWIKRKLSTFNFQLSTFFIVHDDLDIPLGKFKIQFGTGPKLHKGILSIEQALGTTEFWRVRIGIENRKNKMATNNANGYNGLNGYNGFNPSNHSSHSDHFFSSGEEYVLSNFKRAERKILETDVFPKIGEELGEIISTNKYK